MNDPEAPGGFQMRSEVLDLIEIACSIHFVEDQIELAAQRAHAWNIKLVDVARVDTKVGLHTELLQQCAMRIVAFYFAGHGALASKMVSPIARP